MCVLVGDRRWWDRCNDQRTARHENSTDSPGGWRRHHLQGDCLVRCLRVIQEPFQCELLSTRLNFNARQKDCSTPVGNGFISFANSASVHSYCCSMTRQFSRTSIRPVSVNTVLHHEISLYLADGLRRNLALLFTVSVGIAEKVFKVGGQRSRSYWAFSRSEVKGQGHIETKCTFCGRHTLWWRDFAANLFPLWLLFFIIIIIIIIISHVFVPADFCGNSAF